MFIVKLIPRRMFVALLVLGAALLLAAACGDDGGGDGEGDGMPATGETPAAGAATAGIKMISAIQFDKSELAIAADTDVTITADNTEAGTTHNFAVYSSRDDAESGGAPLAATEICSGPCTNTATVNLSAGEYFFRCDVHTALMFGTLNVE